MAVTKQPSAKQLIGGAALLTIGFIPLLQISWAWWALFAAGIPAWYVVFNKDGLKAFRAPKKIWMALVGVVAYFAIAMSIFELSKLVGMEWAENPVSGSLLFFVTKLPIMMMGEELFGVGILEAARARGLSSRSSTLLSALIFGLAHMSVYWDGSFISTVAHVLLLQGVSRLIFNFIYIKTGSIWGSWTTHLLVDIIALAVGG